MRTQVGRQRDVGGGACHYHATRHRYQQRRNHRDQAVADGQDGIGFERLAKGNVELKDSNEESGNDVDTGNENGGNRIALVEAGGTVHRSVELRFARDFLSAFARLMLVDEAGVQVGVNRHLLARHGIEGKAGSNFRGAY